MNEFCRLNIEYLSFVFGGYIIKNNPENDKAKRFPHSSLAPAELRIEGKKGTEHCA
jgi:hypothetical protein